MSSPKTSKKYSKQETKKWAEELIIYISQKTAESTKPESFVTWSQKFKDAHTACTKSAASLHQTAKEMLERIEELDCLTLLQKVQLLFVLKLSVDENMELMLENEGHTLELDEKRKIRSFCSADRTFQRCRLHSASQLPLQGTSCGTSQNGNVLSQRNRPALQHHHNTRKKWLVATQVDEVAAEDQIQAPPTANVNVNNRQEHVEDEMEEFDVENLPIGQTINEEQTEIEEPGKEQNSQKAEKPQRQEGSEKKQKVGEAESGFNCASKRPKLEDEGEGTSTSFNPAISNEQVTSETQEGAEHEHVMKQELQSPSSASNQQPIRKISQVYMIDVMKQLEHIADLFEFVLLENQVYQAQNSKNMNTSISAVAYMYHVLGLLKCCDVEKVQQCDGKTMEVIQFLNLIRDWLVLPFNHGIMKNAVTVIDADIEKLQKNGNERYVLSTYKVQRRLESFLSLFRGE